MYFNALIFSFCPDKFLTRFVWILWGFYNGQIFCNLFILWADIKNNCYWNCCPGPSNRPRPQDKPNLNSWQYPFNKLPCISSGEGQITKAEADKVEVEERLEEMEKVVVSLQAENRRLQTMFASGAAASKSIQVDIYESES